MTEKAEKFGYGFGHCGRILLLKMSTLICIRTILGWGVGERVLRLGRIENESRSVDPFHIHKSKI